MIWVGFALLLSTALAFFLRPLLRADEPEVSAVTSLAVYKDQLAEIDADLQRGLISLAEADAARLEIKRRILVIETTTSQMTSAALPRAAVAVLAVMFSGVAIGAYAWLGQPGLPSQLYAREREQNATARAAVEQLDAMVIKLSEHLKSNPNDIKGWRALGWAQVQLGQVSDAVKSLRRAAQLSPQDIEVQSMFGEALVREADGTVTQEAKAVFEAVLQLDGKEPRAKFYKGLFLSENGQERQALDLWIELLKESPADAEWIPGVRQQALALVLKLKLDPKLVP